MRRYCWKLSNFVSCNYFSFASLSKYICMAHYHKLLDIKRQKRSCSQSIFSSTLYVWRKGHAKSLIHIFSFFRHNFCFNIFLLFFCVDKPKERKIYSFRLIGVWLNTKSRVEFRGVTESSSEQFKNITIALTRKKIWEQEVIQCVYGAYIYPDKGKLSKNLWRTTGTKQYTYTNTHII